MYLPNIYLSIFDYSFTMNYSNYKWNFKGFEEDCTARGIGLKRVVKMRYCLNTCRKLLGKNLDKADRKDVINLLAKIEQSDYKPGSKLDLKVILRKYFTFLGKKEYFDGIKIAMKKKDIPLPKI